MDAVQRKRAQAQQTGNLKSSPQMTVETKKADNGQPYVEIQPANPQVVYVPQYNPVTIYNTPAPTITVVTQAAPTYSGVSTGTAVAIGLLSFGVGMAVGAAITATTTTLPIVGLWWRLLWRPPLLPSAVSPCLPWISPCLRIPPSPELPLEPVQPQRQRECEQQLLQQVQQQYLQPQSQCEQQPQREQSSRSGGPNQPGTRRTGKVNPPTRGLANTPNQRPGGSMANVNPANRPNAGNNLAATNRPNGGYNGAAANRPNVGNNAAPANRPNSANNLAASIGRMGLTT